MFIENLFALFPGENSCSLTTACEEAAVLAPAPQVVAVVAVGLVECETPAEEIAGAQLLPLVPSWVINPTPRFNDFFSSTFPFLSKSV